VPYSNKKRLSIAIDNLFLFSKKSNLSCLIKKKLQMVYFLFNASVAFPAAVVIAVARIILNKLLQKLPFELEF
jgi:hypothetical protein